MDFKTFALIAVMLALSTLTMGVTGHVIRRNTPTYADMQREHSTGFHTPAGAMKQSGYFNFFNYSTNTGKFNKPRYSVGIASGNTLAAANARNKSQTAYETLAKKLDAANKRYQKELAVHKKLVAEADAANQELAHALGHARELQNSAIDAQKSLVQAEQNVLNVDQFLLENAHHYEDMQHSFGLDGANFPGINTKLKIENVVKPIY